MLNKIQTPNQIIITRNGELDPDFVREVRKAKVANMLKATVSHVEALGQVLAGKVGEVITPVLLDYTDHVNGTDLRSEYFEHKQALASSAMRELVEL